MLINGREYDISPGANLRGANLRGANLRSANLQNANLRGANLWGADLCDANLRGANLCDANLRGANLCDANLRGASLCDADLRGADLRYADLRKADLYKADLRKADLRYANLYSADLRKADLHGADPREADLREADLQDANNIAPLTVARLLITPEGDLIGYKKLAGGAICKLKIPADAKRHNANGRKCRAEYAIVLEGEGVSQRDCTFKYRVGEIVRATEPFNEDRWDECSSGIHFFLTREEAEAF